MSLGLPIIANSGLGDTDLILKETQNGVILNSFTDDAYAVAAKELLNMKKRIGEIRSGAKQFFTLDLGIEKYDSIYQYC